VGQAADRGIFADTPGRPGLHPQMRDIEERADEFVLTRDVVVVIDTMRPRGSAAARQRLRPRGFMLAIIDKDGEVKQRRPAPRDAREIMAVIDRFPCGARKSWNSGPRGGAVAAPS
jgi:hypothetical protein